MAVACASRFACLKIEDLEPDQPESATVKSLDHDSTTKNDKSKSDKNKGQQSKSKKKKKNALEAAELQSLAFGINVKEKAKTTNQKKKVRGQASATQWQEWKAKDDKFVTDAFEQDLQTAILESKIDYEEKKAVLEVVQRDSSDDPKQQKKKKKDKMTLDAFQNLLPSQISECANQSSPTDNGAHLERRELSETDFFERIEEDAEKILAKEQRLESFKRHQPFVAEQALNIQYREELDQKDKTIEELRQQVLSLQEELKGAKYRNKKLCHILSHGEIRDKAEILVQVERLTQYRDELTQEVEQLHVSLEQERSKVHALQMELKKQAHKSKDSK